MKGKVFNTTMVQAIQQGRKTQFREVIKVQPKDNQPWVQSQMIDKADRKNYGKLHWTLLDGSYSIKERDNRFFTYHYKVGDVLYIKETYSHTEQLNIHPTDDNYGYVYKADGQPWEDFEGWRWKSPLFMPEKAARLFILITEIKAERLGDISKEDAIKEGIKYLGADLEFGGVEYPGDWYENYGSDGYSFLSAQESFRSLWQSIHGKESWNPDLMVWVYTFEIYQP